MDYARFNYVAQPGDGQKGVRLSPPRFGEYDKFMVKWAYAPIIEAEDMWSEYEVTSRWLHEASFNPVLRYGRQQMDILDPRSQAEDLGDDAVKASEYGTANLKYVLSNLRSWIGDEDKDMSYRKDLYEWVMVQYLTYINHVYSNVGGIYLYEKHAGDAVPFYEVVPAERQKAALTFLMDQLNGLEWLDHQELMTDLPLMGNPSDIVREHIMKLILGCPAKLDLSESKAKDKAYSVSDCMEDIYQYVWGNTMDKKSLSPTQMKIQKLYLRYVGQSVGVNFGVGGSASIADILSEEVLAFAPSFAPSEVSAAGSEPNLAYYTPRQYEELYFSYVMKVRDLLKKSLKHKDNETRLHYELMYHMLENALK
jgi:hypothetical protein